MLVYDSPNEVEITAATDPEKRRTARLSLSKREDQRFKSSVKNAIAYLEAGTWFDGSAKTLVFIEDMHTKHIKNVIRYFTEKKQYSPNAVCLPFMHRELQRRKQQQEREDSKSAADRPTAIRVLKEIATMSDDEFLNVLALIRMGV